MVKFLVHHYDKVTHEYLRSGLDANENPRRLGQIMVPADATTKEPPRVGKRQKAVFITSGELPDAGRWEVKPDYRNIKYYDKATGAEVSLELGEAPNSTITELEPKDGQIWDDATNTWLTPLDVLRKKKDAEIRLARWQTGEQGTITYSGLTFPTDSVSQTKLNEAKSLAQDGFLVPAWQAKDGVLEIHNMQQLIDLCLLVGRFIEAQFGQQFILLTQLGEATTREEIEAVIWPGPADSL